MKLQSISNLRSLLFYNPINHASMRLTKVGYSSMVSYLNMQDYKVDLDSMILPKQLLLLERHMHYPYYIKSLLNLIVFDEPTAVMLQLHNGDLTTYLNNLEGHK